MKILRFFSGRLFITGIVIAIQLVWFLTFWLSLSDYSEIVGVAFSLLSMGMILYIIVRDDNPSFKIGWIIVIMSLPLLGGLLYFFFGSKQPLQKITRKVKDRREHYQRFLPPNLGVIENLKTENQRAATSAEYLQNFCKYPIWQNSKTKYYPVGELMYADMLVELEKAERFIFMEYFIIERGQMWDGILDILKRKAAAGVEVRLMYDDVGCLNLLPRKFYRNMERLGIKCLPFNRFVPMMSVAMNNRDHRKILVIDGRVAFNGGINIADEYINHKKTLGHWKDTGVMLTGDAVRGFTAMFLEMWNAFYIKPDLDIEPYLVTQSDKNATGYVLPFGDSPVNGETISQNVYIDILSQARRYVYIFTPYLIIDFEMQNALRLAAKRGVDVRLITPGVPDKKVIYRMTRSYYHDLIVGGVKIYEYTPGFLHAKSYVCDDEVAVVGTINMDFRSLYLHFECGTFMYGTESVLAVKQDFMETLEKCRRVELKRLKQPLIMRAFDAILRAFAPLA